MNDREPTDLSKPQRREFLGAAAAALFAGVVIQITGCDSEEGASGPTVEAGDEAATSISGNHGHNAIVKKAQLDLGGDLTITVNKGTADHQHTLALTAQEMIDIKAGKMVMKDSGTTKEHNHSVMFN